MPSEGSMVGVIGYLGLRIRQRTDQRRLAGIRKAHQADVSQQFQLQDDGHLLSRLARLCIPGCLIRSGTELEITQSAPATFQQHDLLTVVGHIAHEFSGFGIVDHGSWRHVHIDIFAVGSVALVPPAIAAVPGEDVAFVFQVQQRPVIMIAAQDDVAAPAAVAAVRAAVGVVLDVLQVHRPSPALTRTTQYLYVVYEITLHPTSCLSLSGCQQRYGPGHRNR